ncbi:MAG: DUF6878 family protein [Novosphingobium sp.]
MTTVQPDTPVPTTQPLPFDYDAWRAEDAKRRAAFAEELVGLKTSLFDLLQAHGIVLVTISFDGCGDSGQIEDITARDENGIVDLPDVGLPTRLSDPTAVPGEDKPEPVSDVIETLAYDLLEGEHGGWENNEGAYGEFRFDVAERKITLECNIRISSADYSETSW